MRSRLALSLIFAATAIVAVASDTAAQVQSSIQTAMNGYMEAMKTKDAAKVEAIIKANFAPEFKDIDTKGKVMTREQSITAMKQNISSIKSFKTIKLTVGNVKVKGNQATTVEHLVIKGTIAGPGNKTMTIDVDTTWNGTYVKKGSKWLCTSSKATKESVMLDGKKIDG